MGGQQSQQNNNYAYLLNAQHPFATLEPRERSKHIIQEIGFPHYTSVRLGFNREEGYLVLRMIYSSLMREMVGKESHTMFLNLSTEEDIKKLIYRKKHKFISSMRGEIPSYERDKGRYNFSQYIKGRLGEILLAYIIDELLIFLWNIYEDNGMKFDVLSPRDMPHKRVTTNSRGSYNIHCMDERIDEVDYFSCINLRSGSEEFIHYIVGEAKTGARLIYPWKNGQGRYSVESFVSHFTDKMIRIRQSISVGSNERMYVIMMAPKTTIYSVPKKKYYSPVCREIYHKLRESGINFIALPFLINKNRDIKYFRAISKHLADYLISRWGEVILEELNFYKLPPETSISELSRLLGEGKLYVKRT